MSTKQRDARAFGACYRRWRSCVLRRRNNVRTNEEYIADFELVARRTLRTDEVLLRLFVFHFLLGADFRACAQRLRITELDCRVKCESIKELVGRELRELKPYPLYPLHEYFSGGFRPKAATR